MLKAAVFDIDNTLYDFTAANETAWRALSERACRALSLTPDAFDALHARARRLLEVRCGGSAAIHNRLIRYQLMLELCGGPIALAPELADFYWRTLLDVARPREGAVETLARLRAMGLTIGVGTNMTADWQFAKLDRLGLMPHVDFVVTSEEAGAEKPDRRLFDLCAEKAGCAAGDCLFVGDSLQGDVLGAVRAGMRAAWLCARQDAVGAPPGAACVHSLKELPELIAAL